nr:hypothetical protein B0A51_18125 [Rachicladosporium sp. CCFEE 5018]
MALLDDEEYDVPLRDQRYFGAGIRKRKVKFVPSSTPLQSTSLPTNHEGSAADRYLAIVLGKKPAGDTAKDTHCEDAEVPAQTMGGHEQTSTTKDDDERQFNNDSPTLCEICARPVTNAEQSIAHESSIAHQLCLQHSHPPSHLDRSRKGLAVLRDHGWDPDSRRGLGAEGEGIMYPIRVVENPQKAGLGARLLPVEIREKRAPLDAGKVRQMDQDGKRQAQRLRTAFYMSEDVLKYLGEDAGIDQKPLTGKGRRKRRK